MRGEPRNRGAAECRHCNLAKYCGAACQRDGWRPHKPSCNPLRRGTSDMRRALAVKEAVARNEADPERARIRDMVSRAQAARGPDKIEDPYTGIESMLDENGVVKGLGPLAPKVEFHRPGAQGAKAE